MANILKIPGDLQLVGGAASTRNIVRSVNDGQLNISGGTSASAGANIALLGGSHATLPKVMTFREDSVERMRLEAGILKIGTTAAGNATAGGVKAVGVSEFGTIQLTVNQALNVVTSSGTGRAVLGDSSVSYIWFDVDNRGMRFGASSAVSMGFFGTAPIAKPTGVAVSAAGIHAALVSLGLIAA